MDLLINVILPLSLAIIMLSLGLGLTFGDFTRVAARPRAFAIGALSQVALVPAAALAVIFLFDIKGELAVGIMLLSFCPGGVTSNMLSKLARGDVALSVSLTAVVSLLSILTVPVLAAWSVRHLMGDAGPEVSVAALAFAMFLITTLPVALGVLFRRLAPNAADRIEPALNLIALLLFVVIVLAALVGNWSVFVANIATLGPAMATLMLALLLIGLLLATGFALPWAERKTISIETGIQNATLGITLAALITGQSEGFSTMALPSAFYGVSMYLAALPFVAWYRSRG